MPFSCVCEELILVEFEDVSCHYYDILMIAKIQVAGS